ncbi:COPII subunit [Cladochytrium tenue]|nr:COPII subunit [Cladochytrium tenue]
MPAAAAGVAGAARAAPASLPPVSRVAPGAAASAGVSGLPARPQNQLYPQHLQPQLPQPPQTSPPQWQQQQHQQPPLTSSQWQQPLQQPQWQQQQQHQQQRPQQPQLQHQQPPSQTQAAPQLRSQPQLWQQQPALPQQPHPTSYHTPPAFPTPAAAAFTAAPASTPVTGPANVVPAVAAHRAAPAVASRARRAYASLDDHAALPPPNLAPLPPQPPQPPAAQDLRRASLPPGSYAAPQLPQQSLQQSQPRPLDPPSFGPRQYSEGGTPARGAYPSAPALAQQQQQQAPQVSASFQNLAVSPGQRGAMVNVMQLPGVDVQATLGLKAPAAALAPRQHAASRSPLAACPLLFQRATIAAVPRSPALAAKCKVPLAVLVTPLRDSLPGEAPVPVVDAPRIVRCRRCRMYINPWVQFVEQGTRWKCNMCFLSNEVPTFFDWDEATRTPVDRLARPELTHSVVEYIAQKEYMSRPPQPLALIFVIDVSHAAVACGMPALVAKTILDNLASIPNDADRTKVAFITVDSALHFYNLEPGRTEPQMLVVSDLDDTFLPIPGGLLVSLTEARPLVEKLLAGLGDMFAATTDTQNALPRALLAASKLLTPSGGKIVVFQSTMPSVGDGALKPREDQSILGTPKEWSLLQPANGFYKGLAVDCSRSHICIDLFVTTSQYIDIATLNGCAKYTGGTLNYYPGFHAGRATDASRFATELARHLSHRPGLEAVLRVRATRGLQAAAYHGNFFLSLSDLLALPAARPGDSYAAEFVVQDSVAAPVVIVQSALLFSAADGTRRVRVVSTALPVTDSPADVFAGADQIAVAALAVKKAVLRAHTSGVDAARDELLTPLLSIVEACRTTFATPSQSAQLLLPPGLQLLPLLTLGALKHRAFRTASRVPTDARAAALAALEVASPEDCIAAVHPRLWAPAVDLFGGDAQAAEAEAAAEVATAFASDLEASAADGAPPPVFPATSGTAGELAGLLAPATARLRPLTAASLPAAEPAVLDDGGGALLVWLPRALDQRLCRELFGVDLCADVPAGKMVDLPTEPTPAGRRLAGLVQRLRRRRLLAGSVWPDIVVVKEAGDRSVGVGGSVAPTAGEAIAAAAAARSVFLAALVMDEAGGGGGATPAPAPQTSAWAYQRFLASIRDRTTRTNKIAF